VAARREPDPTSLSSAQINQIFMTNIYGGQANIAAAAGDAVQVSHAPPPEWEEIRHELEEMGIGEADLDELEAAVAKDHAAGAGVGPETQGWLGRMTTRLAVGAGSVATGISADVIAGVILRHIGG
jgi:hypothetical protein